MITYIKINGFKSFQNFEMEFTPLTVIAGANASGKSNLFDALILLSRLADVDLKTAFGDQRGNPLELFTQYGEDWYAHEMEFVVEMLVNRNVKDKWGGFETLNNTRLRYSLVITRKNNSLGFEDLFVKNEGLEKIRPDEDTKPFAINDKLLINCRSFIYKLDEFGDNGLLVELLTDKLFAINDNLLINSTSCKYKLDVASNFSLQLNL